MKTPVPLAARGFLLVLVVGIHVAGAAALSRLSQPLWHSEEPMILRASWIENASPSSSAIQPAEPLPVPHSPPSSTQEPEHRMRSENPVPSQLQAAKQSEPDPAKATITPDALDDPISDVLAVAPVVTGTVDGGDWRSRSRDRDYVGPDFNINYFSNPKPNYPPLSYRLGEQGVVKLRVHVTEEGRADEVTLDTSSGSERLDKAAIDAVKQWRFRPARRAGVPVAGWVIVPVRFEIEGR
ncbi:MAG: energy transducer TonB [Azoarcus sp.]|nr:energy transducer TonB [Azoarcus sp.]